MDKNRITWKIGGEAGYGIMTTGFILSKTFSRAGFHVFDTTEFPSLIRGGHNTYTVRIENQPVFSHVKNVDILVALNSETIELHKGEVSLNGSIIYDGESFKIDKRYVRKDIKLYSVPLIKLAQESGGEKLMQNNVALGASIALTRFSINMLLDIIKDIFNRKGKKVVELNVKSAMAGYDYILKNYRIKSSHRIDRPRNVSKRMLIAGNEAVALAAVKAGCKFYAAYPMTPATSILHYMALRERDYHISVVQPEDEIATIHMGIGASFAGVRSMVATSGGGFALMTEALGLAGISETPLVIIVSQRPGPATGLPTYTEQSDLKFILNASNGEFPRIVVAPGDVNECFYETFNAFNLAEKYQLPVIILLDKYLSEAHVTVERFNDAELKTDRGLMPTDIELKRIKDFKRYEITASGVSPRSIPSQENGIFKACNVEHDEYGRLNDDINVRTKQVDKRFRKLKEAERDIAQPELHGQNDADVTLIGWGSTKGPIKEAMKLFAKKGLKVNYLQVLYLNPFPVRRIREILNNAKRTVIVENNRTGQLASLIKEYTGVDVDHKILKYDGRPFAPEDVFNNVLEVLEYGKLV
jgi:2-oxoglutarate ferredoxin oxidoreductase subunit alpha